MQSPDRLKPTHTRRLRFKEVISNKLTKVATAAILISSCGSGPRTMSPGSYVLEALNNAQNLTGKTIDVKPVTAVDLSPTKTTCTINGENYVADRFGGVPYIIIFIRDKQQQKIFGSPQNKGIIFSPKSLGLDITYEENVTIQNCPVLHPYVASVNNFSS